MTIAVCVRVGEGSVLAADSISALGVAGGAGIGQVYHGSRKVVEIRPGLPLGFATYGQGTLGDESIALLGSQLSRHLLPGGQWEVDPDNYTVAQIADRVAHFYSDRVVAANGAGHAVHTNVGFLISGLSSQGLFTEVFEVVINIDGQVQGPTELDPGAHASLHYRGFTAPLARVIEGAEPNHLAALDGLGIVPQRLQLTRPEMPILDAIELSDWLCRVVSGAVAFSQIAPIVGGEIDVAHISRELGFGWAHRKTLTL